MRKTIISCVILITAVVTGRAQFFIEGELSVRYYEYKDTYSGVSKKSNSHLTIYISPKVGYWLNDRMSVGVNATYITQMVKYKSDPSDPYLEMISGEWHP